MIIQIVRLVNSCFNYELDFKNRVIPITELQSYIVQVLVDPYSKTNKSKIKCLGDEVVVISL